MRLDFSDRGQKASGNSVNAGQLKKLGVLKGNTGMDSDKLPSTVPPVTLHASTQVARLG